jgi:predicted nucleotidyltransferase component of viral defense system
LFKDLRLVGGTALALQLGHRKSIDLDLFGNIDMDGILIKKELEQNGFEVDIHYNSKAIKTFFINKVKTDIVNHSFEWIAPILEDERVRMADKKDIAAMKLAAITNRGSKKDFVDLYFLLEHFTLPEMLEFYSQKYNTDSLFMPIRSLTYFEDAEKETMPNILIATQWQDVKEKIREAVRSL